VLKGNLSALTECQHLPPKLLNVIETVKRRLSQPIDSGRYELEGDDVFFLVVDDHSQLLEERKAEIHQKYIDVQIVLTGEERFGFSMHPFQSIDEDYLDERDLAFSEDVLDEQFVDLHENDFIVFNVKQPHRPLVAINAPMPVRKAVIKIALTWLEA